MTNQTQAQIEANAAQRGADSAPVRKHAPGSYRMTLEGGRFAQFVKGRFTSSAKWGDEFRRDSNGRHWAVEIRDAETGAILRYAGVHLSLREAAEEVRGLRL